MLADLGFYEVQVFGDFCTDFCGGDLEEALLAVRFLSFEGVALFAGEQCLGGPGSAPVDAGGVGVNLVSYLDIGGSCHWVEKQYKIVPLVINYL